MDSGFARRGLANPLLTTPTISYGAPAHQQNPLRALQEWNRCGASVTRFLFVFGVIVLTITAIILTTITMIVIVKRMISFNLRCQAHGSGFTGFLLSHKELSSSASRGINHCSTTAKGHGHGC